MTPSTPAHPSPPGDAPPSPQPESRQPPRPWPGLNRRGLLQALRGLALSLIALVSSYDHISIHGRSIALEQQWGITCIAASLALAPIDAQLATRARNRSAHETDRDRDLAHEERQRADQERSRAEREQDLANRDRKLASRERIRADQDRNRTAEARERQAQVAERQNEHLGLLRRSALLSARVQFDPSDTNRVRLQAFLTLITQQPPEDGGA